MTDFPTAEEIAELIEFCRDELEARKRSDLEDEYIPSAEHALAIAERLPALIAERETIKALERVSSAPAWAASIAMKIANWIRYDWESLQEQRIAEKGLPQWVNSGTYQGGQLDLIDLAMSIAAPLIAERDRLNEMLSHLGALAEAERDALVADRDRLAAEVERVTEEKRQAQIRHIGTVEHAGAALCRAEKAEASLATARETIAKLREDLESAGRQVADGNTILATATIYDALDAAPPASSDPRQTTGEQRDIAAPSDGEVHVIVSGLTGSGKSAIAGEIEIALRAIGVAVEWPDGTAEKNETHADWQTALELYKPRVVIIERNIPRTAK
jgi:hypothetical protein